MKKQSLPWITNKSWLNYQLFLFDGILVMLHGENKHFWFIDTNDLSQHSVFTVPCSELIRFVRSGWSFADKDDNLNLIKLDHAQITVKHVPIRSLIPKGLKKERKSKYLPLVMGYLREQENELNKAI